jgi:hypothetical protein
VQWLGVLPGQKLKASLWHKGDVLRFAINGLKKNGEWFNLTTATGKASSSWSFLEINEVIPDYCRAIMIEITLNQAIDMPAPEVIIDDVSLSVGK